MKTVPTVSRVRVNLKAGRTGTFRMLKIGEEILGSDICYHDSFLESPSDSNVGKKVVDKETILRLEWNE